MVTLAILFSLFLVYIFNFWNNMVIHLGLASEGVSIGGPSHSTVIGWVGKSLPSSHSVGMPQNWLIGLLKTPMEIATSRLGGPQKPT